MEVEVRFNATATTNKFIWPETTLTQYDHGARTVGIMGTQLKTFQN
jgi:hypothetical protein